MPRKAIETVDLPTDLPVYYTLAELQRKSGLSRSQLQAATERGTLVPAARTAEGSLLYSGDGYDQIRQSEIEQLAERARGLGLSADDLAKLVGKNGHNSE